MHLHYHQTACQGKNEKLKNILSEMPRILNNYLYFIIIYKFCFK